MLGRRQKYLSALFVFMMLLCAVSELNGATEISQHEITWTFAQDYTVGQFVNGDWWVLDEGGGVLVSSVDPAPTYSGRHKHGSVINPINSKTQGYDSAISYATYSANIRAQYPLTLHGGQSLVSTKCLEDNQIGFSHPYEDLIGVVLAHGPHFIKTAAVLTCLSVVPANDAFRPPYGGHEKPIYRKSDVRYDLLPKLLPPQFIQNPAYDFEDISAGRKGRKTNVGSVADQFHRYLIRPWILHISDFIGRGSHPVENMPNYHGDVYKVLQEASVLLLCDLDAIDGAGELDKILIPFLQIGIDTHFITAAGGTADSSVHKWPGIFAGLLLDDPGLQSTGYTYRTDWMTYYAPSAQSTISSSIVPAGQCYTGYQTPGGQVPMFRQDPGNLEHEHLDPSTEWQLVPSGGGSKREAYRDINSPGWVGIALAAKLMFAEQLWNHPEFFDYVDRWMLAENEGGQFSRSDFVDEMWDAYRGGLTGTIDYVAYAHFKQQWLLDNCVIPTWCENNDYDRSGMVEIPDLITLSDNWLRGTQTPIIDPTDTCSDAAVVFEGVAYSGSTIGAEGSDVTSCGVNDVSDVWHRYTPTEDGRVTISLCDSDFDTTLAIFDSCGGNELVCSDDSGEECGEQSFTSLDVIGGLTYFIRIAGDLGATGHYKLLISEPIPAPDNDECLKAFFVNEGITYYGNNSRATGTPLAPELNDPNDVWHKFTASGDGVTTISLCGSEFDTILAVFDDCAGNDLERNRHSLECEEQSEITLIVTAGSTYYVRVSGYDQASGDYTLNVSVPIPHPVNDACVDAIDVNENQIYSGTLDGATGSDTSTCNGNDPNDVWYRYNPSQTGDTTISLCGSDFDTTLSVYTSCGSGEWLCNDDACGLQSELAFKVFQGNTYFIRVAGSGIVSGEYELQIATPSPPPPPPANDACGNATAVSENVLYEGSTARATGSALDEYNFNDPNDVWYSYSPSRNGRTFINLCESQFDTTLSVLDSCNGSLLTVNNDSCQAQSEVFLDVLSGENYLIRVSGYNGATGDYGLWVTEPKVPPVYNDCNDAMVVFDGSFEGNSLLADGSDLSSCGYNDPNDVWHRYTPTTSGPVTFSVCSNEFNATLAIFDGCVTTNELACDQYGCASSGITLNLVAGQTYFIRVAGRYFGVGTYTLTIVPET